MDKKPEVSVTVAKRASFKTSCRVRDAHFAATHNSPLAGEEGTSKAKQCCFSRCTKHAQSLPRPLENCSVLAGEPRMLARQGMLPTCYQQDPTVDTLTRAVTRPERQSQVMSVPTWDRASCRLQKLHPSCLPCVLLLRRESAAHRP